MFKKILLLSFLILNTLATLSFAQTYSPWRERIYYNSTLCSALTDGKPTDLCYQHALPLLYVCDNNGQPCTTAAQWQLVTPMYLSGGTIYTYNNYPVQVGSTGTGTLSSVTGLNIDANNDGTYEISIDSGNNVLLPALGASNSGTNFLCLDTNGHIVKSTSACSGT